MKRLGFLIALIYSTSVYSAPALFGVSPDNSSELLLKILASAKKEVLINIYEFKDETIIEATIALIKKGVTVQILVEGQPYINFDHSNLMDPATHEAIKRIQAAMEHTRNKNSTIYVMFDRNKKSRRFVYDHAKYMVVDRKDAYVSSENFSETAYPEAHAEGNRGWHLYIQDPKLVSYLLNLYKTDSSTEHGDVIDLRNGKLPPAAPGKIRPATTQDRKLKSFPIVKGQADVEFAFTSPNSMDKLVELINSAKKEIDLEYMSLPAFWRKQANPVFDALVSAAKRKVKVRMLLNDDEAFGKKPVFNRANLRAACIADQVAREEGLSIEGKIVNRKRLEITYVHNKGMIIDGTRVLVSSINGSKNSMTSNRELGVMINSKDAGNYYGSVFDVDWKLSESLTAATCKPFSKHDASEGDSEDFGSAFHRN